MNARRAPSLTRGLVRWAGLLGLAALLAMVLLAYRLLQDPTLEALSGEARAVRLLSALLAGAALVWMLLLGVAALLAARLHRRLELLRRGADRMADGELELQLPLERLPLELALLGASLQRLARGLSRQARAEEGRRRELDALLAGLRDGVLALDRTGRVQACNPAARRLLGLPHHTQGARLADLGVPPLLLDVVGEGWSEGEWELENSRGAARELRVHTLPLPASPGWTGERLLVVLSDVTSLNQVERLRREFVSNVSHELKTPVTAIRGYSELLREGEDLPATATRFLEVIDRQARRLDAIIDDLLDLSRLERQQREDAPAREPVELDSLLRECADDHRIQATEAGVELQTERQPGTPARVLAHRPLLQRALANLVGNAIRYGGADHVVRLTARRDRRMPDHVLLEVADQGPGIPAEHLPRLFERFYVVDKARSRELGGTGLGLAIVKHAMGVMGGEAGVFSVEGEGSTFWLRLPAAE